MWLRPNTWFSLGIFFSVGLKRCNKKIDLKRIKDLLVSSSSGVHASFNLLFQTNLKLLPVPK